MNDRSPAMTGGCRCGACRYTLAVEAVPAIYCCHCTDCQSWTGSAFSEQAVVREAALTVTGPVTDYRYDTPSGAQSHHRACAVCHARLYNTNTRLPGFAVIRAGTLDDSAALHPRAHIWVASKQPWVEIADGVAAFEENAPQDVFVAIVMGADDD